MKNKGARMKKQGCMWMKKQGRVWMKKTIDKPGTS